MKQAEFVRKQQVQMCSYMLGLVTLLVLGGILGDNGIAYIAAATEGFGLFWTFTGSRVADVLGKMIWNRSTRGQYRNVSKMRKNVMVIECVVGLLGSLLLFFCSAVLAEYVFRVPYCVSLLVILSPVIFLRTISSVFMGYFQGEGMMAPTVTAYVLRQLCVLGLSFVFSKVLGSYGAKVSVLLRQADFVAMYGGMGVALAIALSEIVALIFLVFMYRASKAGRKRGSEGMRTTEDFSSHARVLFVSIMPQIIATFLRILPLWLGLMLFRFTFPGAEALNDYGVYYGKYLPVCGMIILPICALLLEGAVRTAGCVRKDEQRNARNYFQGGLHVGVVHSVFFSVFIAILSSQIAEIFCGRGAELAEKMFKYGAFAILFFVLQFYYSEMLSGVGRKYLFWGSLVLYNIVFAVSAELLMKSGNMGIMALVNAGMFAAGVYVLAVGFLFYYMTRIQIDWIQSVAVPAGAACVIGLVTLFLGRAMTPHLGSLVTVIICLAAAGILYWMILLFMRNFREQELNYAPGGKLLQVIARLLSMI